MSANRKKSLQQPIGRRIFGSGIVDVILVYVFLRNEKDVQCHGYAMAVLSLCGLAGSNYSSSHASCMAI